MADAFHPSWGWPAPISPISPISSPSSHARTAAPEALARSDNFARTVGCARRRPLFISLPAHSCAPPPPPAQYASFRSDTRLLRAEGPARAHFFAPALPDAGLPFISSSGHGTWDASS
ncbi:hypothetical protein VTO73DRAFT_6315 [Trametes versicolor]